MFTHIRVTPGLLTDKHTLRSENTIDTALQERNPMLRAAQGVMSREPGTISLPRLKHRWCFFKCDTASNTERHSTRSAVNAARGGAAGPMAETAGMRSHTRHWTGQSMLPQVLLSLFSGRISAKTCLHFNSTRRIVYCMGCPTSGVAQRAMREAAPHARGVSKARQL
jgi:hypothetical protein